MIIGLTGTYSSGKSFAEKIILEKNPNFIAIDVDKIGHEILQEKKKELAFTFGDSIISNDAVDRKVLGKIVFSDKNKLKLLNNIMHPCMVEKVKSQIDPSKNYIINAALLYDMKLDELCDKILIIKASIFKIIKRGKKRDGNGIIKILKIIFSQKIFYKINKKNTDIHYIYNNKGIKEFRKNIDNFIYKAGVNNGTK